MKVCPPCGHFDAFAILIVISINMWHHYHDIGFFLEIRLYLENIETYIVVPKKYSKAWKRESLQSKKFLEHNSFYVLCACNYFCSDSIGFNFRSLQFFRCSLPCYINSWYKATKFLHSEMFHLQVLLSQRQRTNFQVESFCPKNLLCWKSGYNPLVCLPI